MARRGYAHATVGAECRQGSQQRFHRCPVRVTSRDPPFRVAMRREMRALLRQVGLVMAFVSCRARTRPRRRWDARPRDAGPAGGGGAGGSGVTLDSPARRALKKGRTQNLSAITFAATGESQETTGTAWREENPHGMRVQISGKASVGCSRSAAWTDANTYPHNKELYLTRVYSKQADSAQPCGRIYGSFGKTNS
jgi:hypothetical protein